MTPLELLPFLPIVCCLGFAPRKEIIGSWSNFLLFFCDPTRAIYLRLLPVACWHGLVPRRENFSKYLIQFSNIFLWPPLDIFSSATIDWCQERKMLVNFWFNFPLFLCDHTRVIFLYLLPVLCCHGFAPGKENFEKYLITFSVISVTPPVQFFLLASGSMLTCISVRKGTFW